MNRRFVGFLQILIAGFDLLMINQVIFLGYLYFQNNIATAQVTYYFSFWLFLNTSCYFYVLFSDFITVQAFFILKLFSKRQQGYILYGWFLS